MLYAAGVPDRHTMQTAPHVGIASVWWEGNPCKYVIEYSYHESRTDFRLTGD